MYFPTVYYTDIHTNQRHVLDVEDLICPLSKAEIQALPRPNEHMHTRKSLPWTPTRAGDWFELGYVFEPGEIYAVADARGIFWRSEIVE